MLSISINHPDIEEFITKKQDLTKVTGANISVKVNDEFMKAVENNEDYFLRYPVDQDLSYFSKDYLDVEYNKLAYLEDHKNDNKIFYVKKIKAKELWDTLMHCAWNTAEPGIMFESAMHNYSPDGGYEDFKMISTNPCFHPDTLIDTVEGKKRIVDITEPTYVYSMTEDGHICIVQSSAAFKTKENAKTLKITLRNGSSIMVTPEHKLFVHNIGFVEAKDLKVGDRIAHILEESSGDMKYKLTTEINVNEVNNDIISIEEGEQVDVYDIQVPGTNCLIANNMVAHNCGCL